jgi:monoamine oxidase
MSAMKRLRLIYGAAAKAPTAFLRTRWHQDPYTLGSYSFNAVGMAQDARAKLAAPINHKLYFAGEATDSDYYGTVHGAYLSGLDTAKKISG